MSKVKENIRFYIFPEGEDLMVEDVREILVSESGGHRLTCKGGQLIYVPYKWIGIEIHSDNGWEA